MARSLATCERCLRGEFPNNFTQHRHPGSRAGAHFKVHQNQPPRYPLACFTGCRVKPGMTDQAPLLSGVPGQARHDGVSVQLRQASKINATGNVSTEITVETTITALAWLTKVS